MKTIPLTISVFLYAAITTIASAEALTPNQIFDAISGEDTFVEDAAFETSVRTNYAFSSENTNSLLTSNEFWQEDENILSGYQD